MQHLRGRNASAFPDSKVTVVDELSVETVLVLAPHPDDEVIGPGGSLCHYIDNGSSVTVLYLTDGGASGANRQQLVDTRRREAESVGREFGIRQVFWNQRDTRLTSDRETVGQLAELIEQIQPTVIFLPHYFDHHFDHFATNQILADTLKQLPNLAAEIVGYEVWDNVWLPNYVVNVSKQFSRKCDLMNRYQTPLEAMDFIKLMECRATVHYMLHVSHGLKHGQTGFAEAFCRFDIATYCQLFADYLRCLKGNPRVATGNSQAPSIPSEAI